MHEIEKMTNLYDKTRYKKRRYKKNCKEIQEANNVTIERLEKDIKYFREKVNNYLTKK